MMESRSAALCAVLSVILLQCSSIQAEANNNTVSCVNSANRCTLSDCLFYPAGTWERCGQTCDTPALCHRDSGESDFRCGNYARKGLCERNANIRENICPYTCSLRANITCEDPNRLFPHAVASRQMPHWMDHMSFKCEPGYINMGVSSWAACSMKGTVVVRFSVNVPHCVPEKVYDRFRYSPKSIRLEIMESLHAKSVFYCAIACRGSSSCTHYIFESNTCDLCKLPRWRSHGFNTSGRKLWQKVLPTQ